MKIPLLRAAAATGAFILLCVCITVVDELLEPISLSNAQMLGIADANNGTNFPINSSAPSYEDEEDFQEDVPIIPLHGDDTIQSVQSVVEKRESRVMADLVKLRRVKRRGKSPDRFVEVDNNEQKQEDEEVIDANEHEPELVQDDDFVSNTWKPEWSLLTS
jgi:hypothetical protein